MTVSTSIKSLPNITSGNFMTLSFKFNKENVHRTWIWVSKGFAEILSFYLANSKQYEAV